jgi:hypothetical protein
VEAKHYKRGATAMKRIIIINEGPTEQEFCKDVLLDYFISKDILIEMPTIKSTHGGIVAWGTLKKQIEAHLKHDSTAYITTLFDYYGIKDSYNYPRWQEAKSIVDKSARLDFLEEAMRSDLSPEIRERFIPYMQLHEFEGLLFCDIDIFRNNFEPEEANLAELEKIINSFNNPEEINNGATTAPSKRLETLIPGYLKVVYGACLASDLGLKKIREKCPRFSEWIDKMESI